MVAGETTAPPYREALLIRTLLNHPWLLEEYSEAVAALPSGLNCAFAATGRNAFCASCGKFA